MAVSVSRHNEVLTVLRDALGLPKDLHITGIVIEAKTESTTKVYVVGHLDSDRLPAVADWCHLVRADAVTVSEKGEVMATVQPCVPSEKEIALVEAAEKVKSQNWRLIPAGLPLYFCDSCNQGIDDLNSHDCPKKAESQTGGVKKYIDTSRIGPYGMTPETWKIMSNEQRISWTSYHAGKGMMFAACPRCGFPRRGGRCEFCQTQDMRDEPPAAADAIGKGPGGTWGAVRGIVCAAGRTMDAAGHWDKWDNDSWILKGSIENSPLAPGVIATAQFEQFNIKVVVYADGGFHSCIAPHWKSPELSKLGALRFFHEYTGE